MPNKITLFEPHFHDAQFGPTVHEAGTTESDDQPREEAQETDADASGGRSKLKLLLFAAIAAGIGFAAYRRLAGNDAFEIQVEELETEEATVSE